VLLLNINTIRSEVLILQLSSIELIIMAVFPTTDLSGIAILIGGLEDGPTIGPTFDMDEFDSMEVCNYCHTKQDA